eukprot:TRINITY_DN1026_c0_g1_i9.p1 TRINITY_DN1026_c0_g1~~TRINITY_DN1026_c0_g1_i9.p1  ORF type:complete len:195 (-),score=19.21 TRINITY_DN1026_c0_g1_i9:268-852(-)
MEELTEGANDVAGEIAEAEASPRVSGCLLAMKKVSKACASLANFFDFFHSLCSVRPCCKVHLPTAISLCQWARSIGWAEMRNLVDGALANSSPWNRGAGLCLWDSGICSTVAIMVLILLMLETCVQVGLPRVVGRSDVQVDGLPMMKTCETAGDCGFFFTFASSELLSHFTHVAFVNSQASALGNSSSMTLFVI